MSQRIDLAAIDNDIAQASNRIIKNAFAYGITNDMVFGGIEAEQTSLQAITAISATQNCRLGTRRVTWDGMVYRYTEAEATLKTTYLAHSSNSRQEVGYSIVTTGALAGANSIIFTLDGSDGDGSGGLAVNYLADGFICIDMGQTNADALYQMRIKSNTAVTGGGACTVVVDGVFPLAVTDAMYVEAMASPYKGLTNEGLTGKHVSYMGLPQRAATTSYPYSWILTWGPCWVTPNNGLATVNLGNSDYVSQVVAHPTVYGGSVGAHDDGYALSEYMQHVGFVLSWAQAGTQGAPFIMLQISP